MPLGICLFNSLSAMFQTFEDLKEAYENAVSAISELKSNAQSMIEELESIVESCETIEDAL